MSSFDKQIKEYSEEYRKRMKRVFGESVQELSIEANRPVGKGGLMRVDTGFLRSSLKGKRNSMPSGPTEPEQGKEYNKTQAIDSAQQESIASELLRWQAGEKFYLGWSAEYARFREYKDGFMKTAAGKWNAIVKKAVKKHT